MESMSRNPGGDVLTAVTRLTEKLKSGRLTPEEETLTLKMLIHLVGDMHCPMHAGRLSDLGGNLRPVRFFGATRTCIRSGIRTFPRRSTNGVTASGSSRSTG